MNDTHVPLMFIGKKKAVRLQTIHNFLSFLFLFYFIFQYISHIYMDKMENHTKTIIKQMHVIRILIEMMAK